MISRTGIGWGGLLALLLTAACRGAERPAQRGERADTTGPPAASAPASPASAGAHVFVPTIVFLGTSLTAGYGLDPEEAYPAVIQRKLDSLGLRYRVVNAGVSGESSAGALNRIGWILRQPPAILVIETGANDGLRGQDLDQLRANLQGIVDSTRRRAPGARIVLAGMEALPNLGAEYTRRFRSIYREVAAANHLPLIPFLLAGVGGVDSLNQEDGIHPNAAGARVVAENVWRVLRPLLEGGGG
ncbi:MAG TPA: arylesterase [Gemmatimonadales bacterium]|nr:arylesterase [Gemmatimonadales bacterium]